MAPPHSDPAPPQRGATHTPCIVLGLRPRISDSHCLMNCCTLSAAHPHTRPLRTSNPLLHKLPPPLNAPQQPQRTLMGEAWASTVRWPTRAELTLELSWAGGSSVAAPSQVSLPPSLPRSLNHTSHSLSIDDHEGEVGMAQHLARQVCGPTLRPRATMRVSHDVCHASTCKRVSHSDLKRQVSVSGKHAGHEVCCAGTSKHM